MPGFGFAPATAFANRTANRAAGGIAPLTLDFSALDSRLAFSRASAATAVDSSGLIAVAANDVARFAHDPVSLAPLGLLIEEQRTNREIRSEDIQAGMTLQTAAGMQPVGSGSAVNRIAGPDGNTGADFIAEYSNSGQHYAFGVTASTAATRTYSVFCRQGTRAKGRIQIGASSMSSGVYADIDLAAGTIAAQAVKGSGYTAAGQSGIARHANGFLRVSVTAAAPAAAHVGYVSHRDPAGNTSYAGDGASGAYVWGWQLEDGAFRTSYIPTNGSAATRAADVCSTTHADFAAWLARAEKTVVVTADSPASGTRRVLHAARTGSEATDYLSIWTSAATLKATVVAGGVMQADLTLGTIAAGVPFTVAVSLGTTGVSASLDGGAALTHSSAAMPAYDRLWFGCGPAGEQLCGHLAGTWRFIGESGDVQALSA